MKQIALSIFLILVVSALPFAQENLGDGDGFGLQASIFNMTRSVNTNVNSNFSNASNYNLTPGDTFTLVLSGGIGLNATGAVKAASYGIQLQEDYTLDIPVLGRISARGRRIPELQREISEGLIKALALQHVSFTLSAPAQFNVFVYGNVKKPGFVVVTPMHRLIDAISVSGGFKSNGSYRSIRLERNGVPKELDISRFYSHAELASNPYLRPGDTIFVPDAQIVASISGLVQFPGVYELVRGENLDVLINLAGGTLPGAQPDRLELRRVDPTGSVRRISVSADDSSNLEMVAGDSVVVRSLSENVERITIEGAVFGSRLAGDSPVQVPDRSFRIDFPYYPGISLLDVLDDVGGPTPRAIPENSFLRRKATGETLSIELEELWKTRDELEDKELFPGDYIFIPLQPRVVFVSGAVNSPGAVEHQTGYSVADYLLLSGGMDENEGDGDKIYLLDESGNRERIQTTDSVEPGSHIHVGKKWLFMTDRTMQNIFITTAWVTTIVTAVTTVWEFIATYVIPAPAGQ